MLAIELYQTLNNDGVQLWAEGEKLRFAPKEKITPFLLAELKANKNELLSLLAANDPTPPKHIATDSPPTTNELLRHYEKPLFNHLLACPYCHVEKAQYCLNGYAMGSVYDALLLCRDDAQAKRANLALRVDRAKIKGVFR